MLTFLQREETTKFKELSAIQYRIFLNNLNYCGINYASQMNLTTMLKAQEANVLSQVESLQHQKQYCYNLMLMKQCEEVVESAVVESACPLHAEQKNVEVIFPQMKTTPLVTPVVILPKQKETKAAFVVPETLEQTAIAQLVRISNDCRTKVQKRKEAKPTSLVLDTLEQTSIDPLVRISNDCITKVQKRQEGRREETSKEVKSKKQKIANDFWALFNSLCDGCLFKGFYVKIRPTLIPHERVTKSEMLTKITEWAIPNKWHQRSYLRNISLTFAHDARGVLHNKKNSKSATKPYDELSNLDIPIVGSLLVCALGRPNNSKTYATTWFFMVWK